MKISYSDLAQIVNAVRDTKDFDGISNVHEFMDRLDEKGDQEIEIRQSYGVTMFTLEEDR